MNLPKANLIVANFSLPFSKKEYFNLIWNEINNSLLKGGYFVGNFFGLRDTWAETKENRVFLSRKQVLELFNEFEIIDFQENEKDGKTGLGKIKHWHTFDIIAKKK